MKSQDVKYENKYLSAVAKGLGNKRKKKILCDELESHILDKADYYQEIGYTKEEALQKATEDMGNAEETSIALDNLHNVKWYKQPFNIVVITLLLIQFVGLLLFYPELKYTYDAIRIHYIYKDFISLLILCFNCFILYLGYKKKSKAVLIAEGISLFSHFYLNPYQPLFFGIIKTVSSGLNNYVNSIFSYEFICENVGWFMALFAAMLTSAMLCYCIGSLKEIFDMERGKCRKNHRKFHIIAQRAIAVFICCNMLFMTASTCISYNNKINTDEDSWELRSDIAEFMLTFDIKGNPTYDEALEEITMFLNNYGEDYRSEELNGILFFYVGNVSLGIANTSEMFNESGSEYSMIYSPSETHKDITQIDEEFIVKECEYNQIVKWMTMEDFLATGLHSKAANIQRDSNHPDSAGLLFKLKDNDFRYIDFERNMCVDMYNYSDVAAENAQADAIE